MEEVPVSPPVIVYTVKINNKGSCKDYIDQKVMERRKKLYHMIAAFSPAISFRNYVWA
jgi:hypothetical protein